MEVGIRMAHDVVHDQIASLYADGVDRVWSSWEPSLRTVEELLGSNQHRFQFHSDDLAARFRKAQYRAHVAGEFAVGLVPPVTAAQSHDQLVGVLSVCRDTLSVLAVRAELEELDEETALIGLLAVDATRDAFRGARDSGADVRSWLDAATGTPTWIEPESRPSRFTTALMWTLIAVCAVLFVALVAEVFLLGAGS